MLLTTDILTAEIAAGGGLSLAQAARLIPPTRGGRPTHSSCVYRWCTAGTIGTDGQRHRLEAARCGCRTLTTDGALRRYLAALSGGVTAAVAEIRTPTRRAREHAAATAALAKLGIS